MRNEMAARQRECVKRLHKNVRFSRCLASEGVEMPHHLEKHNSNERRSRATSVNCSRVGAGRPLVDRPYPPLEPVLARFRAHSSHLRLDTGLISYRDSIGTSHIPFQRSHRFRSSASSQTEMVSKQ